MALNLPETFTYEKHGHVAVMTLNRPQAMNALTKEMMLGLEAAVEDFNRDPEMWVAIFTANGEKAFCTGLDLKVALPALNEGDDMGYDDPATRPFHKVYKPVISAVNGICVAGGLEFMLGTDIRIAAEHATFGLTEVRWAVIPAGGSHVRLPRQIPWAVAMEMLMTGKTIDAKRAYEINNDVFERFGLLRVAEAKLTQRHQRAFEAVAEDAGQIGKERGLPLLCGARHRADCNAEPLAIAIG